MASNSAPFTLSATACLSSLILRVTGSNQTRFVSPPTEAVISAAMDPVVNAKGAVNANIAGEKD